MNVGLEGNIFERDFSRLGKLSEDCWFKKTWELCHRFKVSIIIHERYDIPLTRSRDKALMECFVDNGAYNIIDLVVLNRGSRLSPYFRSRQILYRTSRQNSFCFSWVFFLRDPSVERMADQNVQILSKLPLLNSINTIAGEKALHS